MYPTLRRLRLLALVVGTALALAACQGVATGDQARADAAVADLTGYANDFAVFLNGANENLPGGDRRGTRHRARPHAEVRGRLDRVR